MNEPSPDVIRAAAAGDVAAFEDLVRLYEEPVWRFLCHLLVDRRLAEDVSQETFLHVYRRLGTFSFRSKFSTWVFSVAHNSAVDALRREGRRLRVSEVSSLPSGDDRGLELRAEVEQAISSLPARLRNALLTVEVLGLTYREAGEVLGVPEGTVKSRVFHARARVAAWFQAGEQADEV